MVPLAVTLPANVAEPLARINAEGLAPDGGYEAKVISVRPARLTPIFPSASALTP